MAAPMLETYIACEGYRALERALCQSPEEIIQRVELSGLRGRGGAGFPTGKKWRAVSSERSNFSACIATAFIDKLPCRLPPSLITGSLRTLSLRIVLRAVWMSSSGAQAKTSLLMASLTGVSAAI